MNIRRIGLARTPAIVGATALGVALLALSGCAAGGSDSGKGDSATISVSGEVIKTVSRDLVTGASNWSTHWNDFCDYEGTRAGSRVTVRDSDGGVVGVGDLAPTEDRDFTYEDAGTQGTKGSAFVSGKCVNTFDIDVDSDSEFFTVEVAGVSGAVDLTRAELIAGPKLSAP